MKYLVTEIWFKVLKWPPDSFSRFFLQETTETVVHDIGALLFFTSGVLYIVLQSVMSYRAHPAGSSVAVCRVRSGVAVLAVLAFFPCILSSLSASRGSLWIARYRRPTPFLFNGSFRRHLCVHRAAKHTAQRRRRQGRLSSAILTRAPFWQRSCVCVCVCVCVPQDYPFHVASAVCEWIVAFSFICFFLTYIDDFKVSILTIFFFLPTCTSCCEWFSLLFFFLFPPAVHHTSENRMREEALTSLQTAGDVTLFWKAFYALCTFFIYTARLL